MIKDAQRTTIEGENEVIEFSDNVAISWLYFDFWPVKLLWNLVAYATLTLPVFVFIYFAKRRRIFQRNAELHSKNQFKSFLYRALKLLVVGGDQQQSSLLPTDNSPAKSKQLVADVDRLRAALGEFGLLMFCFLGLQVSYLTWGVLQEKLMTKAYWVPSGTNGERVLKKFTDSQFLVFANRLTALFVSSTYMAFIASPIAHPMPFYKYFYASFSNIMSSWCQYEALKFITFPAQVLGKASKIIPVMVMGKCVERRSYKWHEYATGLAISVGVCLFLLYGEQSNDGGVSKKRRYYVTETTWSGVVLMIGYLLFDSFTSNWQGALYTKYRLSSMQMMCGVNTFSAILTLVALSEQSQLWACLKLLFESSEVFFDVALTSVSSAVGQVFIFYTIAQFGAVTFTIIMTVRQALSILLSCLIYGHHIYTEGILGICIVFISLLARSYLGKK